MERASSSIGKRRQQGIPLPPCQRMALAVVQGAGWLADTGRHQPEALTDRDAWGASGLQLLRPQTCCKLMREG